jgi:hypothetical protein
MHRPVQTCADLIVSVVSNKVGRHKSIYVRASDLELWQRAESYANERRMTTSGLVMLALERYLSADAPPEKGKR